VSASDPNNVLLSNPPGFVLLALMFALAAYLRQMGEDRERLLEEIQGNRVWNFPEGKEHTNLKIRRLRISRSLFRWIARLCIAFSAIVGCRLALLAYVRCFFPDDTAHFGHLFRLLDFWIVSELFILVCVLGVIHEVGRANDRKIGTKMEIWLLEYLATQEVLSDLSATNSLNDLSPRSEPEPPTAQRTC
jgi:hypothetical protein